jgi:hypothetical protein
LKQKTVKSSSTTELHLTKKELAVAVVTVVANPAESQMNHAPVAETAIANRLILLHKGTAPYRVIYQPTG